MNNQLKEKYQRLTNFIECLSKKEYSKCHKLAEKVDFATSNYAKICIQNVSIIDSLQKIKKDDFEKIRSLKEEIRKLKENKEMIERVKGFKLNAAQKEINDTLSIFNLIKQGLFIQAKRSTRQSFPFIQDLIEYKELKTILYANKSQKEYHREEFIGSRQYKDLKQSLFSSGLHKERLEAELQSYILRLNGTSDEEDWVQPEYLSHQIYEGIKKIQFNNRVLLEQNRNLREFVNQGTNQHDDELIEKEPLVKSLNFEQHNLEYVRILESRIRQISTLIRNQKRFLINQKPQDLLNDIGNEINDLKNINRMLMSSQNRIEAELPRDMQILSYEERIKELQKSQKYFKEKLIGICDSIVSMISNSFINYYKNQNDYDEILMAIQSNLKNLFYENKEKERQFNYIKSERDNYSIECNKMNFYENISEALTETAEQIQFRNSKPNSEQFYEQLSNKLQLLEVQKQYLQSQCKEQEIMISEHIKTIEQKENLLKLKEKEFNSMKLEREQHEKMAIDFKTREKKQANKIIQLQKGCHSNSKIEESFISKNPSNTELNEQNILQSSLNSNEASVHQCEQYKKRIQELTQSNAKLITQQQQQSKLHRQLMQKESKQKQRLEEKIQSIKAKHQKEINEYNEQMCTLQNMMQAFQNQIKQLQGQIQASRTNTNPSSALLSARMSSRILLQFDEAKIEELTKQNNEYQLKIKKFEEDFPYMRSRIKQLEASNIKYLSDFTKISREKKELNDKYENLEQALVKVKEELQAALLKQLPIVDNQKLQLQQRLSSLQDMNTSLRAQINSLKCKKDEEMNLVDIYQENTLFLREKHQHILKQLQRQRHRSQLLEKSCRIIIDLDLEKVPTKKLFEAVEQFQKLQQLIHSNQESIPSNDFIQIQGSQYYAKFLKSSIFLKEQDDQKK